MQRAEVLEVVRAVVHRLLGVQPDRVQEDMSFADLAVDSLALVEYAMALEDELQVRLDERELGAINTVGELVDLLVERTRPG